MTRSDIRENLEFQTLGRLRASRPARGQAVHRLAAADFLLTDIAI